MKTHTYALAGTLSPETQLPSYATRLVGLDGEEKSPWVTSEMPMVGTSQNLDWGTE